MGFPAVASLQKSAQENPGDVSVWLDLAVAYEECATAIGSRRFRPFTITQNELVGLLHSLALQGMVSLREMAVAYCQRAAARIPERRTWGRPGPMEPNLPLDKPGRKAR